MGQASSGGDNWCPQRGQPNGDWSAQAGCSVCGGDAGAFETVLRENTSSIATPAPGRWSTAVGAGTPGGRFTRAPQPDGAVPRRAGGHAVGAEAIPRCILTSCSTGCSPAPARTGTGLWSRCGLDRSARRGAARRSAGMATRSRNWSRWSARAAAGATVGSAPPTRRVAAVAHQTRSKTTRRSVVTIRRKGKIAAPPVAAVDLSICAGHVGRAGATLGELDPA